MPRLIVNPGKGCCPHWYVNFMESLQLSYSPRPRFGGEGLGVRGPAFARAAPPPPPPPPPRWGGGGGGGGGAPAFARAAPSPPAPLPRSGGEGSQNQRGRSARSTASVNCSVCRVAPGSSSPLPWCAWPLII